MEITACPKCGSRNIAMGTMSSGVLFGVTSWKSVCKECGYQGEPLLFDTEDDYKKFLRGFVTETNAEKTGEPEKIDTITDEEEIRQLSKKDKEVVELLHEFEQEGQPEEKTMKEKIFPENKVWWPEIVISMVISAIVLFFYANFLFNFYGLFFGAILSFASFFFETLSIIVIFIVIEYGYKKMKK